MEIQPAKKKQQQQQQKNMKVCQPDDSHQIKYTHATSRTAYDG